MTTAFSGADRRTRGIDALRILDTPAEDRFDRFTRFARLIFGVPIAAITLLDGERAWFKSCVGFDNVTEVPTNETFCDLTVRRAEQLVVPDAQADPRTRELPVVAGEPHIRFYAGHPVHDAQGNAIGTLCIFDRRRRELDDRQRAVLAELASWVDHELLQADASERATAVQAGLLPSRAPDVPGWSASAVWLPTYDVSGDYFDAIAMGDDHFFVVADVMGKGTGAAILTATVRAALRAETRAFHLGHLGAEATLADVVNGVNEVMLPDLAASSSFVTGFVGWLSPEARGVLRFVDAGHGLSVLIRANGDVVRLGATDLPLGVTDAWRWTEHTVDINEGDTLVVVSDGLLDLVGGDPDALAPLWAGAGDGPRALAARIRELAESQPRLDDVTALVIRRDAG